VVWLFDCFVSSTGKHVLSDFEIALFLLSPRGIAALLVLGAMVICAQTLETGALLDILFHRLGGRAITLREAFSRMLARLPRLLGLALIITAALLALTAPFLFAMARLVLPLLSEFDINYYLARRPPEFWRAVITMLPLCLVYLGILLYLYLAWLLALPLMLYRGIGAAGALGESRRLFIRHRGLVPAALLSWLIPVIIVWSLLGGAGKVLADLALAWPSSLTAVILTVGLVVASQSLCAYIFSLLALASRCALLMRLYFELYPGETVPDFAEPNTPRRCFWALGWQAWTGLALAGFLSAALIGYSQLRSLVTAADVLIIAHRGSSAAAPENTLAAVSKALEEGTDFVEIDVQETADGQIVVLHDKDLKRVAGVDLKIGEATYAQASGFDIGSWFAPEFSSERLPFLTDIIQLCRGRAGVIIELKYTEQAKELARRVLEILAAQNFKSDVEIMSLHYPGIQEVRKLDPSMPVGFLSNVSLGKLSQTDVDFLAVSGQTASRRFIHDSHGSGKKVYVWTINTAREMALFIDRGVDGLITDRPALARRVIQEMNSLSLPQRLLLRLGSQLGAPPPQEYEQ